MLSVIIKARFLTLIPVAFLISSCMESKQPQIGDYKKVVSSSDENADHPRVAVELDQSEQAQQEPVATPETQVLSQAEILLLDTVTIKGNGGLQENSPGFENRYTDPNGKPLNNASNPLVLKVGQVLNVCNDASARAGLAIHTNGTPFPHGRNIGPGSCAEHRIRSTFNSSGSNLYDHNLGGSFVSRAYPIYIKVVSESEAEAIISSSDD